MTNPEFYAVILSGGSGERFWPLSTPDRPKQFLTVFGGKSLIRQSVDRLAELVPPERILVVTAESLIKATRRELPMLPRSNIVAEPCRRDTAAAVATACGLVERIGGAGAVAAILTADHIMGDEAAFRKVLADAARAAMATDDIVTMGVTPTHPATGFGYIQVGDAVTLGTETVFHRACRFVEKPDEPTARRYLASGRYVWNAGMFVWKVSTMKSALAQGAPVLADLAAAVADRHRPVARTLAAIYPGLPRISIDYAVMEKVRNILVSRGDFGWDDVGTWSSADRHLSTDARHNVLKGDVAVLDVSDTVAIATEDAPKIAALGVNNLVIVATGKSVLVADKSRVQDLKKILAVMAEKKD
jgi:mannose-1-phosphate guanylyltransferase